MSQFQHLTQEAP